jgi:hypothetical protein
VAPSIVDEISISRIHLSRCELYVLHVRSSRDSSPLNVPTEMSSEGTVRVSPHIAFDHSFLG